MEYFLVALFLLTCIQPKYPEISLSEIVGVILVCTASCVKNISLSNFVQSHLTQRLRFIRVQSMPLLLSENLSSKCAKLHTGNKQQ